MPRVLKPKRGINSNKSGGNALRTQGLLDLLIPQQNDNIYTPIGSNQVRLLRLQPAQSITDRVICFLNVVNFDNIPHKYDALSYTWGTDAPSREITIQTRERGVSGAREAVLAVKALKRFYVRSNLDQALRRLRDIEDTQEERTLWVDAICIDQRNENEKSTQVAKMADIYGRADSVYIWLGEQSDDSDAAIEFAYDMLDLEKLQTLVNKESSPRKWSALVSLMRREWFGRRWVVQELSLAKEAYLHCGESMIHWKDFAEAIALFAEEYGNIQALFSNTTEFRQNPEVLGDIRTFSSTAIVSIYNKYFRRSQEGEIERLASLEVLVSELLMFESTDPRDTIYALLSIAQDTYTPRPRPYGSNRFNDMRTPLNFNSLAFRSDYNKNILDVFKDFTAFCVLKSGSLDIICRHWAPNKVRPSYRYVDRFKPMVTIPLPSWIGLLSESAFGLPSSKTGSRVAADSLVGPPLSRRYNACGGMKAQVYFGEVDAPEAAQIDGNRDILQQNEIPPYNVANYKTTAEETLLPNRKRRSDGCLYVRGFNLEEVEKVSHRLFEGLISAEWLRKGGWVDSKNNETQSVPDQLWKTLVADKDPDGNPTPGWYHGAISFAIAKRNANGDIHSANLIRQGKPERMVEFLKRASDILWNKKFFLTSSHNGLTKPGFGLGPTKSKEGDILCILLGCTVPVILRAVNDPEDPERSSYEFIGEAYMYGIMDGEAIVEYSSLSDEELMQYTTEFRLV